MAPKHHQQTLDPRRSGQVKRYHVWPHIHDQSCGEHCWQLMRILLAIWPEAPREVLIHIMVHDIGETVAGDLPYPVKADNKDLKAIMDRLENDGHLAMCLPWSLPPPQRLGDEEKNIVKLAEYLEMAEWGMYEIELGNSHDSLVVRRCLEAAAKMAVPEWCRKAAEAYTERRSVWHNKIMDQRKSF